MKHARVDAKGRRLRQGDIVRVVGAPDLSPMSQPGRRESEPVFAHIVGTYKKIDAFDKYGCAELNFSIRDGKHRGLHTVWIEPFLLRIRGGAKRHLTSRLTRTRRKRRAG